MPERFRIALVGAGQMGSALIRGLITARFCEPGQILAADSRKEVLLELASKLGIQTASSTGAVPDMVSTVVLAVKPQDVPNALAELSPSMGSRHLLISVAAGIPMGFLEDRLSAGVRVIRAMPNTPCLLGMGCTAVAPGKLATPADMATAKEIFGAVGQTLEVQEKWMDAITGLSGSGPAYLFLFAQSLVEAGVRQGIPWQVARTMVYQTLRGAAEMLLVSGEHPARLIEQVASPGGTTLAGLAALERGSFRWLLLQAVEEATRRGEELSRHLT